MHKKEKCNLCKIVKGNCNMDKKVLIERIETLCQEKGVSLHIAFTESKVGKNFKSNLNYAEPTLGKIKLLADYLGVTAEYLLGETDERFTKEKSPAGAGLKEKHWRLITAYERAEEPIKDAVDRLLKIEDKPVLVKIAARDGSFQEREITQEEWEKIQGLPDANL